MTERRLAAEDPVARRSMDPDGCATSMLGISAGALARDQGDPSRTRLGGTVGERRPKTASFVRANTRKRPIPAHRIGDPAVAAEGLVGRR